ncbi:MAG: helix-turn-helix domain-containing protein [Sphingobacteriia bacterium]|jgi:AraC-like DNA-binding protein
MKINIFNIIVLLGSIQGFILGIFFLVSKKLNRKSNFFLGLLLLSFSMVNLANCLWDMGVSQENKLLQFIPLNWTLMIPFSLNYFVQYLVNPKYEFNKKEYFLLVPFFIQQTQKLIQLGLFIKNPLLLNEWALYFDIIIYSLEIVAILYCLIVFVVAVKRINQFQIKLQNQFADIEQRSLAWLKRILIKIAVLLTLWILPYVFASIYHTDVNNYMYPLWIGMTLVIYWLAWSMFSRRDIFEYTLPEILSPVENMDTPNLISSEKPGSGKWDQHYQELIQLIEKEKLFLDMDISMSSLAQKMQLSNGYLSQIINQQENLNFYDFINRFRVEEVKKRLIDPQFQHLSMYGLALDCGFKSKSTFNSVFKKMTGLTPSDFKSKHG